MNLFEKKRQPLVAVIHELFLFLNIKVTYSSVKDRLLQHPQFPSLFSMTNTLENFGLKNRAVKIKKGLLPQLEVPFLALTRSHETVLVKTVDDDTVTYFNPAQGWLTSEIQEFEILWKNMVILVDTTVKFSEKEYLRKRNLEKLRGLRLLIAPILMGMVFLSVFLRLDGILQKLAFLTNLTGLIAAVLLIKKEMGHTEYSFCKWGSKMNCDDVLNSKAARIYGWLSLSDIGVLYFSSKTLLFLVISLQSQNVGALIFTLMITLGFLALPYTFYSIFYQGFAIKKWCTLCLGVVGVLWLNGILGYLYLAQTGFRFNIDGRSFLIFGLCLLIPATVWMFLKGMLKKSMAHETLYYSNLRMVNDSQVFQFLLQKQESTLMDFQQMEIVLGNPEAKNTLTVAMNPYCPACGREYVHILQLLEKQPNFTNVILRFVGNTQYLDKNKIYASTVLIDRYLHDKPGFNNALKDWFEIRDLGKFLKKYPTEHMKTTESILKHHFTWSEKVNVDMTPTCFLNDRKLDSGVSIKNLLNMLDMNP